ncbi:MAG TPA: M23 family metallopeptidase [Rhizomicrobium sp.]
MKTLVLAAFSILFLAPGAAAPALADGAWSWPLDDYGRDAIGHDYAEYNACLKTCNHRIHLHNTGIDVPAPKGTPVKAVEDGFVVNLVPNDTGCSSDCTDHGYGNTMVIQHTGTRFSEYSHMLNFHDKDPLIAQIKAHCAFYDRTDENGVHVSGWECARRDNVVVKQGDVIGQVGATGSGSNNASPPHLRFEGTTFPTLYSYSCYNDDVCCPKHKCFGYSGIHPFQAAYIDPVNLEETTDGKGKVHVQVGPQGEGTGLRIGPDERYDLQTRWHAADGAYWAIRSAVATKNCDQGWYKVMKAKQFPPTLEQYFDPTDAARFGAGTLPDTWVCIGNGGDQYVVPVL